MAWIPAVIGAVGSIAGAASSLSDNGDSSATAAQSNQVSPASWGSLGNDASGLWDSFVQQMFGGITDKSMTDAKLSPEKTQRFWELQNEINSLQRWVDMKATIGDASRTDMIEVEKAQSKIDYLTGLSKYEFPEVYTPSLKEKMNTNYDSQKKTGEQYLTDMTTAGKGLTDSTAANTGQYQGSLDTIAQNAQTPYMKFVIGGQPVNAISKRQLSLADTLSQLAQDKYKSGGIMNQTNYDMSKGNADRALNQGMQFTPYGADVQYLDKLWPIISQLQGYRYGTPSTVESSTANVGTTLAEKMAALAQGAQTGNNLWSLFNNNSGTAANTAQALSSSDIAAGNYTPV